MFKKKCMLIRRIYVYMGTGNSWIRLAFYQNSSSISVNFNSERRIEMCNELFPNLITVEYVEFSTEVCVNFWTASSANKSFGIFSKCTHDF